MLALAFGFGAALAAGALYLFQGAAPQPPPPASSTIAATPPADAVVPAPAPAPPPPTFAGPAPNGPPPAVEASASATIDQQPVAPRDTSPLNVNEILEVQVRLKGLGMSPGRIDGVYGPKTAAAIRRYEEAKGQPQTGNLDRETLKQLRADPDSPVPEVKRDPPYQPAQARRAND